MTHTIIPAFSKIIYETKLTYSDNELNDMINYVSKLKYSSSIGYYTKEHKDKKELYTNASTTKSILEDNFFKDLKDNIMKKFNTFKNDIMYYTNNDFEITTSWVSKTKKDETSFYHNHHNCMYSGIFYLSAVDGTGDLSFENFDNYRFKLNPSIHNVYNSKELKFNVKNNTLLFFPSECHHRVLSHKSDKTRYSIAFNLIPKGKLGIEGEDSFLVL